MVNKLFCENCMCYTDETHTAKMLEFNRYNRKHNEWTREQLYLTTYAVQNDYEIIKHHTPTEIPKEHEYLINTILNAHGRGKDKQWIKK